MFETVLWLSSRFGRNDSKLLFENWTKQSANVLNKVSTHYNNNEQVKHSTESLILAQDERWRRA